ncbi:hypothetical protein BD779DRAFT_1801342 [Infundibulicybe gibba]|nr:hypothetical protein BD779DRAFT_1801342 [Infundibulicybe gibba]
MLLKFMCLELVPPIAHGTLLVHMPFLAARPPGTSVSFMLSSPDRISHSPDSPFLAPTSSTRSCFCMKRGLEKHASSLLSKVFAEETPASLYAPLTEASLHPLETPRNARSDLESSAMPYWTANTLCSSPKGKDQLPSSYSPSQLRHNLTLKLEFILTLDPSSPIYIMDSFILTTASVEDIASAPSDEEDGGSGVGGYCVVA